MNERVRIGISTCPNDTFAFDALLRDTIDTRGLKFEFELLDIQELNQRWRAGVFDVAKMSFHAALSHADSAVVLPSGSALGYGVGPLLLAATADTAPINERQLTLCPGSDTTGTLLMRIFYPDTTRIEQTVFSDIMPRLKSGTADFGVCIHEGRFTWQSEQLHLVEDLGERWERETGCPLPLGGLIASRSLGDDRLDRIQACVKESIKTALARPQDAQPTMHRYAQELDPDVLMKHVDLYVNQWTIDLGQSGQSALDELCRRARSAGVIVADGPMLRVHAGC